MLFVKFSGYLTVNHFWKFIISHSGVKKKKMNNELFIQLGFVPDTDSGRQLKSPVPDHFFLFLEPVLSNEKVFSK